MMRFVWHNSKIKIFVKLQISISIELNFSDSWALRQYVVSFFELLDFSFEGNGPSEVKE